MTTKNIIGHSNQISYLKKICQSGMIPQSFLFTGIDGIGKFSIANFFAKLIFCTDQENIPCNNCNACLSIDSESNQDLIIIKPDEKNNIIVGDRDKPEIGSIRWLIKRLQQKSISGKTVVIIDGAETINESGQNALLKTIEEPGANTYIILISSTKSKILPTIQSRSVEIKFNPLLENQVLEILKSMDADKKNIEISAFFSGGSIKTAKIFLNDENLNIFKEITTHIKNFIIEDYPISLSLTDLQKKVDENIIDILFNIYGIFYRTDLSKVPNFIPDDFILSNKTHIRKIMDILLEMKKNSILNINLNYNIKSLLYSLK